MTGIKDLRRFVEGRSKEKNVSNLRCRHEEKSRTLLRMREELGDTRLKTENGEVILTRKVPMVICVKTIMMNLQIKQGSKNET